MGARDISLAPAIAVAGLTSLLALTATSSWGRQGQSPDPFAADKKIKETVDYNSHTRYDWAWGELEFARTYPTSLRVKNDCGYEQTVVVDVESGVEPFITIPATVKAPPGVSNIDITITTPPAPEKPPMTDPTLGPPPPFERFIDIKGRIMLDQEPNNFGSECLGGIKLYNVTGHVHYFPPDPEDGDVCAVFWMSNRVPPPGEECATPYRGFAAHHIEALQPIIDADPAAWAWLPSAGDLLGMGEEALVALKRRITEQRAAIR